MKKVISLLFFLLASTTSTAGELIYGLLPKNSIAAEASYLGGDQEMERISQKMAQAVTHDTTWMQSYLAKLNLKPGELLPYHPRFGITKLEYEYLTSKVNKLSLISLGKVTVNVEKFPANTKVVISNDRLRLSFLIDQEKDTITTNRGELITRTNINADESMPFGAWKGQQWSRSVERTGFSEKIAIGRSLDGKSAIIYYDIRSPDEGVISHLINRYPI